MHPPISAERSMTARRFVAHVLRPPQPRDRRRGQPLHVAVQNSRLQFATPVVGRKHLTGLSRFFVVVLPRTISPPVVLGEHGSESAFGVISLENGPGTIRGPAYTRWKVPCR